MRKRYPTDLTDRQWQIIKLLIPSAKPGGRPRKQNMRSIVNAVFYVVRTGCQWRMLPHDYPKWKTVYDYFRNWKQQGVWEKIHDVLRRKVRKKAGRKATPSAGSIDSQSAKNTQKGGR